ncbi:hypothetical protein [Lacinutrix sp.]|uniref:hypothetical protein n=1 Tax=Lacinutrix sp. TaxID=1937692 RepID=UPI0025BF4E38|nr:hypothetical protein [Lacinutrix sp.]
MLRNILATIVGLIAAIITITIIEKLGHVVFPYPEGAQTDDMEWLKNNTALIPKGAMVSVILAHSLGVIAGMGIAGLISKTSLIPAYIVGGIMLTTTAVMLFLIPSPIWFSISDALGVIAGFYFGKTLAERNVFN